MSLSLAAAGDGGSPAVYVGGTLPGLRAKASGILLMTGGDALFFRARHVAVEVAWDQVNLLEYGQQASRRYAMAILLSPILVLSKSKKHFLTIGYTDREGKQQALIFQIDKNHIRAVLAALEAKTGRRVEFQDNEARRSGKG